MPNPSPSRILRLPEVETRTGLSRSAIYAMEGRGAFPRRVKIGRRATGWLESEVSDWIEQCAAARPTASCA